jgi:hypothetical protein
MTVLAALTLTVFTVGLPVTMWALLVRRSDHPLCSLLLLPYSGWARWLWVVPLRFGRKLYFAALMCAWNFADPSTASQLALSVFASLIGLLVVQVRCNWHVWHCCSCS